MFVRTKRVQHGERVYEYESVVRSVRVNGKVRQETVASLGRVPHSSADDKAELVRVLLRLAGEDVPESGTPRRAAATASGGLDLGETRSFGNVYAVEDAWRSLGLDAILRELARDRQFGFDLERAVFAMVANRLIDARSKLGVADWLWRDVYLPTGVPLDADQFYRTLGWLAGVQGEVELALYRKLLAAGRLDGTAVFYDTTTTWFEGRGPEALAEFGRKHGAHPPSRRLILIGLVRSLNGWPIAHHVFPGNTNDVTTVEPVLRDLRDRFGIRLCIFICDRGMMSADVVALLESLGLNYIIATKLRGDEDVREKILARQGRYHEVDEQLGVKEVAFGHQRYVVCRNPLEVDADRRRREEILDTLRTKHLDRRCRVGTKRAKELEVNASFRRYLSVMGDQLVIDEAKVEADTRYDGKWVLLTNLDREKYPAAEVARLYKLEAGIEKDFRDIKSFIELRPVYHHLDANVRAHVFVCVLAKVVARELEGRLHASGFVGTSVEAALAELGHIKVVEVGSGEKPDYVRTRILSAQDVLLRRLGIDPAKLPKRLPWYETQQPRLIKLDNVELERQRQERKRQRHQAWLAGREERRRQLARRRSAES